MHSMPKRLRLEVEDGEGAKYTLSFQGSISEEKLAKISGFINLMNQHSKEPLLGDPNTTFGKVCRLIELKFPLGSFSSSDIINLFEDEHSEEIKLSTVATYLARLETRGQLSREKTNSGWSYKRPKIAHITK